MSPLCGHLRPRRAYGFTLIELILVIVITGILSVGAFTFIHNLSTGYQLSAARGQLAATGWNLMARLQTELRQAVPGSLRLSHNASAQCLEYVPVRGEVIGRNTEGEWLWHPAVSVMNTAGLVSQHWLIADVSSPPEVYGGTQEPLRRQLAEVQRPVARTAAARARSLSGASRQVADSRHWRYLVSAPVSVCLLADGRLLRYQGYGWQPVQPLPGNGLALTAASSQTAVQRQLLARGLLSDGPPFVLLPVAGAGHAGALLQLRLTLQSAMGTDDPPLQLTRTLRLSYAQAADRVRSGDAL